MNYTNSGIAIALKFSRPGAIAILKLFRECDRSIACAFDQTINENR
ncbi:hypothetical protein QUA82_13840 [Microcoleus sp. F8-D3]